MIITIAVARWPMMVFLLPARNEENSGDPWKKSFKWYWESYHGVQVNDDVAPFEWSCIRVEMPYKIVDNNVSFIRTFVITQHSIFVIYNLERCKRIESWKHWPIFSSFMDAIDSKNLLNFNMDTLSFHTVILVYKRCFCFWIKCQIFVCIDTGDPNT